MKNMQKMATRILSDYGFKETHIGFLESDNYPLWLDFNSGGVELLTITEEDNVNDSIAYLYEDCTTKEFLGLIKRIQKSEPFDAPF